MEFTVPQFVLFVIGQLVAAAAIWGGIRTDLRSIHQRIERVEKSIDDAHGRIDRHFDGEERRAKGR